jgi:hypothetical protein
MSENEDHTIKDEERKIALQYLEELLTKIPLERRSSPEIGFGSKILTPDQFVNEVKAGTIEGNLIVQAISEHYQELKRKDR